MRGNHRKNSAVGKHSGSLLPLLFVLALFILHLALPDKTFSTEERRYLAQWPAFDLEQVFSGGYGAKVEAYFSDQFPWRDFWMRMSLRLSADAGD